MSIDEQHVALPKLYGAPAYARPPSPVPSTPRPFDPDELPILAFQTDEERQLSESLPARAYAPGGGVYIDVDGPADHRNGHEEHPKARPLSLRAIAGRLLRS